MGDYQVKVKGKGVLGSGGIAPRILDLGTRWRWVVSFTPRPLYPRGNSPAYPLDRRLGGPQSRCGRGEEKNSQPLLGLEPPIIQLVAQSYTTELTRLLAQKMTLLHGVSFLFNPPAMDFITSTTLERESL
jgi:hypothetical protein